VLVGHGREVYGVGETHGFAENPVEEGLTRGTRGRESGDWERRKAKKCEEKDGSREKYQLLVSNLASTRLFEDEGRGSKRLTNSKSTSFLLFFVSSEKGRVVATFPPPALRQSTVMSVLPFSHAQSIAYWILPPLASLICSTTSLSE
jgi:hypothetical protein